MKISCPACSAKYSIADDRVQDRLAKIRCRKCSATIVIDGKATPPHVYTAQGEATEMADHGEAEYSVDFGEGDQRTMTAREIATAYKNGTITGDTYVWTEGFADWKPLSEVPELLEAVQASSRGQSKQSPWESRAGGTSRAAARAGGRSSTADLFGGIDTAGSEDDVATSAPDHSSSSSHTSTSTTGARNESSVLFSLSALTSAANARPSTRPSSSASRDDSGLIDLKALTAAAMKSDTNAASPAVPAVPAVAPIAPLGVPSPLGLAAPLGGGITATTDIAAGYPQPKSKAPLFIGGGIAVGMIAIAAALLLRPAPPPPPAPIVVAPPSPTPTEAPAAVAAAAPSPAPTQEDAKPPATGAAEDPPPPTTSKTTAPSRTQPTRRTSTSTAAPKKTETSSTPAAPAKTTPAPKKSGGCGCAPGDLQCAMRCAAKGG